MRLRIPATSANLGPGFDSLGLALGLYNWCSIEFATSLRIAIKGEGEKNPKLRSDNVFVRIFSHQFHYLTGEMPVCEFVFENSIPISRGLGSSSAVIIGALSAAFKLAGLPINKQKIINLALYYENHPDNITPACVGGFTACMTQANRVKFLKKRLPSYLKAIIAIPSQPISTHHSRHQLPKKYSQKDAVFNLSHAALLSAAFFQEKWEMLKEASLDRFHQYYRMKSLPVLFEVQKVALQNGALMSTLSGSGSSFFSLCYGDDAQSLANALELQFPKMRIETFDFDNDGVGFYDDF